MGLMSAKRAFSFGGGRQSTAALVLAVRGELNVDCFVFANVGDDAENPDTLAYVNEWSKPYALAHGIELVEVQRKFKDGRNPSLFNYLHNVRRSVPIPMRLMPDGAPGTRTCTTDWKIRVIADYLKRRGWRECELLLGISWDEAHRMRDPEAIVERGLTYARRYPLCEMRLTVADCQRIVAEAGLPPPPKSSCWFCPFTPISGWAKLRLNRPDLFEQAVELERGLNAVRIHIGKDSMYLTDRCKPLDLAVPEGAEQLDLFEEGACTSGYCWT